jgi:L-ascorbate metabolism protein UlaG (beta-lactamase superfamily)
METEEFSVVFDYFKDSGDSYGRGFVNDELLRRKGRLYVLASHFHPDHFNSDILQWKNLKSDIVYILSSDILANGKAVEKDGIFLNKGEIWEDENIYVKAFGSTDEGVSFLLRTGGRNFFHAGDLNNWHWKDESSDKEVAEAEAFYLSELEDIAAGVERIDLAMFPVDPRLGSDYMRGAWQFVDRIGVGAFAPMHFGEAYEKANAFDSIARRYGCDFIRLSCKGDSFIVN